MWGKLLEVFSKLLHLVGVYFAFKYGEKSAEAKEMTKVLEQQESTKSKSKEEVLKRLRKNARRG